MSCEKLPSSGAKIVRPPESDVMSWELIWLMSWVVLSKRIRTLNDLAFLRILMMPSVEESDEADEGDWGNVGTVGCAGAFGDAAGACANVVVEYKEVKRRRIEKENKACFIFLMAIAIEGS